MVRAIDESHRRTQGELVLIGVMKVGHRGRHLIGGCFSNWDSVSKRRVAWNAVVYSKNGM